MQIVKQHGAWHVRYYENDEDGNRVRRMKRLVAISDQYRNKGDVISLARRVAPTDTHNAPEASLPFSEFVEQYFLPDIERQVRERKREPATLKFYREVYDNHLHDRVGMIPLAAFTTADAQRLLDSIDLSHQSLLRIKTGISAVFSYAKRINVIGVSGVNPVIGTKVEGRRTKPERYAYSLDEIEFMLKKLPEPARTVVAAAGLTGFSASEIRGLQWRDITDGEISVERKVWRTHVGATKTTERQAAIPVIPLLKEILDEHRKRVKPETDEEFVFKGERKGFALHLDNLSRRVITPIIGERWHGWHAFRRGLGTNLFKLGTADTTIQRILRHSDVETTRQHYIVLESGQVQKKAMKRFSNALKGWKVSGHVRKNGRQQTASKLEIASKIAVKAEVAQW